MGETGRYHLTSYGVPIEQIVDTDVRLFGSECLACGNVTPDSMTCDSCKSSARTTELWISADAVYDDETAPGVGG